MISFTMQDVEQIKAKAAQNPSFISQLEKATENVRRKRYIQETAKATWSHFLLCPEHTVSLIMDYDDPINYKCPICDKVYTGEPYEGAWWVTILGTNCSATFMLAVMYMITEKQEYLDIVHEILIEYAKRYPSYEVHGEIPYNKPGKFAAQVLDDSGFLNDLARAYDITKDTFTSDEQKLIENDLLLEGAKHLMAYYTPQIHNHEVAIASALGIIGIILGREDIISRAVDEKYGLKYQLDYAVLEDSLWFEGTNGYHAYALRWFMSYEKFARYTKYSLTSDEHYATKLKNMLKYFKQVQLPDNSFPALNDGSASGYKNAEYLFEFGHALFSDDEDILWCLHQTIKETNRESIETLLYGVMDLPQAKEHEFKNYITAKGSKIAVLYGDNDRYFLFKNTPYGGEHDHYDRLAICFSAYGKKMCSDLGTASGYGAPLHYAYFKNTATHNTVAINGDNMPPASAKVNSYIERSRDDIYLDAEVDWIGENEMPDSFVIKQWCDESYKGAKMRRIIQWYGKYFVDIFVVGAPNNLDKEWILHIDGKLATKLPENGVFHKIISDKNPQKHIHDVMFAVQSGVIKNVYDCGDDVYLSVHTLADGKTMMYGEGPDNPSVKDIAYLMQRSNKNKIVYVNVFEPHKKDEEIINKVNASIDGSKVSVIITQNDGTAKEFNVEV